MWVRPWKLPLNTIVWGRLVTCLASLIAASVISAPELAKKNVSIAPGVSSLSLAASGSSRSCLYTLTCAWMNRCAWSAIALATCGWAWPVELTAMPAAKSRYSAPSVVVTQQPLPLATCSGVTENHTLDR